MKAEKIPSVKLYYEFVAADGHKVRHDFEPWLQASDDLNTAMDEMASKLAFAGAFYGLLIEADEVLDSEYRAWRATEGESILSMDKKMSEHKIKQLVESHTEFLKWKQKTAKMSGMLKAMDIVVRSLASMSDTLRSRGANRRAEMISIGMSTSEQSSDEREAKQLNEDDAREMRERRVEEAVAKTNNRRNHE
jgi:hypothetical protein